MRTVDDEELNMYMNVRDEKDGEWTCRHHVKLTVSTNTLAEGCSLLSLISCSTPHFFP
jgi:hypothetical protein